MDTDALLSSWGSSTLLNVWRCGTCCGWSTEWRVGNLDGKVTSVGKVGLLKVWLSSLRDSVGGLIGDVWFRNIDSLDEVWNWGSRVTNWLPDESFVKLFCFDVFEGLMCVFAFTDLISVSVSGSLGFANGELVETAWFRIGPMKSWGGILLPPCTAGGLAAWIFAFAPVISIELLLSVRLAEGS